MNKRELKAYMIKTFTQELMNRGHRRPVARQMAKKMVQEQVENAKKREKNK